MYTCVAVDHYSDPDCVEKWSRETLENFLDYWYGNTWLSSGDVRAALNGGTWKEMGQLIADGSGQVGFITKDSGQRQDFGNGSLRDTNDGKPRPDLIHPLLVKRLGELLARGAKKYGDRNWERGQLTSRFRESLYRHLLSYDLGDREEDHLAAAVYNLMGLMAFEGDDTWDDINTK